jgi:hypothetical protein
LEKMRRYGFAAVVVVACAGALTLWVWYAAYNFERVSTQDMAVHADFDTFHLSAQALLAGRDIYETGARLTNLNPPFFTILMSPFGFMEPANAYSLFETIMVLLTTASLVWITAELRLRSWWAVLALVVLLLGSPMLATLALGQIYPLLLLWLVGSWVADRGGMPKLSGAALGLVVAVKPTLLPILLWPTMRRHWQAVGAAIAVGAAATLFGIVVAGYENTLAYAKLLLDGSVSAYWDNASIPSLAARLFTENEWAVPLAIAPLMVPVAYFLGLGVLVLTAVRAGRDPELSLWALVAAALLASPIAWNNYLILLGPGILILIARRRVTLAFLLLALQVIPPQWPLIWDDIDAVWASIPISLYFFSLFLHWLALLPSAKRRPGPMPKEGAAAVVT